MNRKEAYEFLMFCRDTHQEWVDFFRKNPELESQYAQTIGTPDYNSSMVDKYNEILSMLKIDLFKESLEKEEFELDKIARLCDND